MTGPRVLAVGLVLRSDGALLVTAGRDPLTGDTWHRLIGGGVERGERGADALSREFTEEFGVAVEVGPRLAALENLFTYNGEAGHEVVLVYSARLLDPAVEARRMLLSVEHEHPPGIWVRPEEARLVPVELRALLPDS